MTGARPVVTDSWGNKDAYEAIESEDLLARISDCNKKVTMKIEEKLKREEYVDLEEEIIIFGNDIIALFPNITS